MAEECLICPVSTIVLVSSQESFIGHIQKKVMFQSQVSENLRKETKTKTHKQNNNKTPKANKTFFFFLMCSWYYFFLSPFLHKFLRQTESSVNQKIKPSQNTQKHNSFLLFFLFFCFLGKKMQPTKYNRSL